MDFPGYKVKVAGLNIHYKLCGEGTPVVLVHGGGNDWHEWKQNLAFLSQHFRVIALDLPGFGLSEAPDIPVSPFWNVAFLKDFMDSLGISGTHLIGHSMGAMISIIFAADYPEYIKKIVLIDAGGIGKLSRKGRFLLAVFRTTDRLRGMKRGPKFLSVSAEAWLVRDRLPRIKSPVLIVWGRNDLYLPVSQARTAHNLIPGSNLHIFPGCGHAPQRESADEFNSLVLQFLEETA